MEDRMIKSEIKKFNDLQKNALNEIVESLIEIEKLKYSVVYWDEKGCFNVKQVEKFENLNNEEHEFLNYYWCEYTKDNINYKITMFYKDFDHGSGNIHILPGGIQIWQKKGCCACADKGFCEKELKRPRIKDGKIEYWCSGGKPYTEFGWEPLIENLQLWNNKVLEDLINNLNNNLNKGSFKVIESDIDSKSFYKSVIGYPKESVSSQSRGKYILLQFNKAFLYYKTMYIKGYGYFTKFDGEKIEFKKYEGDEKNMNEKGPNHYDWEEGKWIIEEKLF